MRLVGSKNNKDQLKQYFNSSDLALYKPNKDQCDIYTGYEVGNIPYNAYQIRSNEKKEEARSGEKVNELSLTSNNIVVIYSDL